MKKIFEVKLWMNGHTDSDAYATLSLPATPYELLDALGKIHLKAGDFPHWKITAYYADNRQILETQGTIYELNALAQRLSELDERQDIAYRGLVSMEKGKPTPLSRMIDLAYGTDCCHVVTAAKSDSQLGAFYIRSGCVPEIKELSEEQRVLLDFGKIGLIRRHAEGGIYVKKDFSDTLGYVVKHTEPVEYSKNLDLTLKQPRYSFLLRIAPHISVSRCGRRIQLELPATQDTLNAVLSKLTVTDWRKTVWVGLDCCVPRLTGMVYDIGVNGEFNQKWMERLNDLAQTLAEMGPKELGTYKALLDATDCSDINTAQKLADTLDDYIFSPQFSSPIEVAKGELSAILCDNEAEIIIPHLNLYQYGEALIQNCGGSLTSYGLIERVDGQPVQVVEIRPGGMEMGL